MIESSLILIKRTRQDLDRVIIVYRNIYSLDGIDRELLFFLLKSQYLGSLGFNDSAWKKTKGESYL